MNKRPNVLVRRQLLLVILTIILCTALISIVFNVYAQQLFIEQKAGDFTDNAAAVWEIYTYQRAKMLPPDFFSEYVRGSLQQWDANVVIYESDGTAVAASTSDGKHYDALEDMPMVKLTRPLVQSVLLGQQMKVLGEKFSFGGTLLVGEPMRDAQGEVVGAVFLARKVAEMNGTIRSFNTALRVSSVAVLILMLIPTYMAAKLFVRPIYQMRDVALRMARGDYSARANAYGQGELGELAASFNYLAEQLGYTIQALRLEKNRLTSIINGLGEGIVAVDAQGEITHLNPALLQMFGRKEEAGAYDRGALIPDEALWRDFDETTQNRCSTLRNMTMDNGTILRVIIAPLVDDDGQIEGAVGLFRDVTEAERLEQTRRDYVANVSHELRTPVSSVRGLAEALKDGLVKKEEDRQRYYGYILRETMRLTRLIEDLLELSRLQGSTDAFAMGKVDMNELLFEFADRYRLTVEDVDINFELHLPQECLYAYTNPDRVEQVLVVLLDNAIKHTQSEGAITLSLQRGKGGIEVSLSDTGVGIDQKELPHLFERFYKVDKAHSGQGTGLGLSIANEVVQRLGGDMQVESALGEGARFAFTVQGVGREAPPRTLQGDSPP